MCQNCVASLFLLIFLTFCVVRDHEAMGSNPVTPTIKNTHALFALCFFYLPAIRDLNGTLRKQHSALFLVPGVSTALAAQKKAHKTPAPVGLRSKSRHSDHKKHTCNFATCVFYLPVIDVTKKSFSVNGFIAENSQKGKKM